jgi:hypothetical protein
VRRTARLKPKHLQATPAPAHRGREADVGKVRAAAPGAGMSARVWPAPGPSCAHRSAEPPDGCRRNAGRPRTGPSRHGPTIGTSGLNLSRLLNFRNRRRRGLPPVFRRARLDQLGPDRDHARNCRDRCGLAFNRSLRGQDCLARGSAADRAVHRRVPGSSPQVQRRREWAPSISMKRVLRVPSVSSPLLVEGRPPRRIG